MKITMQKKFGTSDTHDIRVDFDKDSSSLISITGVENAIEVYKVIIKSYEYGNLKQTIDECAKVAIR